MKHEVTSFQTKRMLADSLKRSMQKKAFAKITVSEIIEDCGVNRKTFYYHFGDIYELLKWMLEEEAIDVVKHFDLLVDYEEAIRFVMNYVEENDYIISCAYHSMGREEMKRFFYADFIGVTSTVIDAEEARLNLTLEADLKLFVAKFYTEAMAGMLIDWAQEKDKRDKEKTIRYLTMIVGTAIESMKKANVAF